MFSVSHTQLEADMLLCWGPCRQGAFLLVDVIRLEGETLESYHAREVADVSTTWTGLDHEGRASMCDHMMKVRDPLRMGQVAGGAVLQPPGHNGKCKCS